MFNGDTYDSLVVSSLALSIININESNNSGDPVTLCKMFIFFMFNGDAYDSLVVSSLVLTHIQCNEVRIYKFVRHRLDICITFHLVI